MSLRWQRWSLQGGIGLEAPKYTPPPVSSIFEFFFVSLSVDAAHTTFSFVREVYQTSIFKPILESCSWLLEGATLFSGILSFTLERQNLATQLSPVGIGYHLVSKAFFEAQFFCSTVIASEVNASSTDGRLAAKIVVYLKSASRSIPGRQYIRNGI